MPVILHRGDYEAWMSPDTSPADAERLLRPLPDGELEAYAVSTLVNKVANDGPELVTPA